MQFRHVHIYRDPAPKLNFESMAKEISKIFPGCQIDVRAPFLQYWQQELPDVAEKLSAIVISDIKQPFEKQKRINRDHSNTLYDGFMMQRLFGSLIPENESHTEHVHVIFTNMLTCTFSEDDWRYHARAVVCGTPSIVSVSGIIEAPAKPREFYLAQIQHGLGAEMQEVKKKLAARFIDYDDERINAAAVGYILQSLVFFLSDGDPFCDDVNCRLFNSHWQEDVIRTQVERSEICKKHHDVIQNFNDSSSSITKS